MATLKKLMAQRADIERKIADFQRANKTEGVQKVKALMAEYGLSVADLAGVGRGPGRPAAAPKASTKAAAGKRSTAGRKVAPKYRDKATGNTWSGRGLKPRWLSQALAAGKKIEDFKI